MKTNSTKIIAQNRKARFNYEILDIYEAGIVLTGPEVKSLRQNKVNITDTYAACDKDQVLIHNLHIDEYKNTHISEAYKPRRIRKLLLHRREIKKLQGSIDQKGLTIVPLKMYFNSSGIAKIEIATARGKKLYDKRETEKKRDWDRSKLRVMKNNN
tara:strand:+ start:3156 stop:3623 length:468 start_codon:yes stop_codon:yes gene_type:complete